MVLISDQIKALLEVKENLLEEHERLVEILKTKHTELYNWIVKNDIDLANLSIFAANITAALVLAYNDNYALVSKHENLIPESAGPIDVQELQMLNEEERANLVWEKYHDVITVVGDRYKVDPKIIFATIMVESKGDSFAVRQEPAIGDASYGLGQLLYGTAVGLGFDGSPDGLYDPMTNIDLIARYYRRSMDTYGENLSIEQMAAAYNAGNPYGYPIPGHVDKFIRWFNKAGEFTV
jgi:soluble lytic murein transglycosylase-like protein